MPQVSGTEVRKACDLGEVSSCALPWQSVQAAQDVPWQTLLALWANYNRYLAHIITHLPAAKLDIPCRIGASQPVTLRFLAADYLSHLVHHLEQIGSRAASAAR